MGAAFETSKLGIAVLLLVSTTTKVCGCELELLHDLLELDRISRLNIANERCAKAVLLVATKANPPTQTIAVVWCLPVVDRPDGATTDPQRRATSQESNVRLWTGKKLS